MNKCNVALAAYWLACAPLIVTAAEIDGVKLTPEQSENLVDIWEWWLRRELPNCNHWFELPESRTTLDALTPMELCRIDTARVVASKLVSSGAEMSEEILSVGHRTRMTSLELSGLSDQGSVRTWTHALLDGQLASDIEPNAVVRALEAKLVDENGAPLPRAERERAVREFWQDRLRETQ